MIASRITIRRAASLLGALSLLLAPASCGSSSPLSTAVGSSNEAQPINAQGLTVTAEGRGAQILRMDDAASTDGATERLQGKLITGPGGCLALQPGSEPELLIFGQEVDFLTYPPRVTIGGTTTSVGQQLSTLGAKISIADLDGVPAHCVDGASETAWVIAAV